MKSLEMFADVQWEVHGLSSDVKWGVADVKKSLAVIASAKVDMDALHTIIRHGATRKRTVREWSMISENMII